MDLISTPPLLVYYSSDLFCPLVVAFTVTQCTSKSTRHTPLVLPSPSLPVFLSHTLSLSHTSTHTHTHTHTHSHTHTHTHSLCRSPMVTCRLSKQDKLSTHRSQQCACPLSLAHPARQTKTPREAPTTGPFKCQAPCLKSQTAV